MNLVLIKEDGTRVEVPYKPTDAKAQAHAVSIYLIRKGERRPSEAAMEVSTMSKAKLRQLYQKLVLVGEIKQ